MTAIDDRRLSADRGVDCDEFQSGGGARRAEFIFADDTLAMVSILTEARDEAELLRQMTLAYGPPTHKNEKFHRLRKPRSCATN